MAGLIHELMKILEQEIECYHNILAVSRQKTPIIVEGNVPALQSLIQIEQEQVGRSIRLERDRQKIVQDIAIVINEKQEDLTISRLIEVLHTAPDDAEKLKQYQSQMIDTVLELKEVNEQNKKLLEQSLEFIDFTMNAIQSRRTIPNNSYHSGGVASEQGGRSFFDRKQ